MRTILQAHIKTPLTPLLETYSGQLLRVKILGKYADSWHIDKAPVYVCEILETSGEFKTGDIQGVSTCFLVKRTCFNKTKTLSTNELAKLTPDNMPLSALATAQRKR